MKYPRLSFSRPGFARSGQDTGFEDTGYDRSICVNNLPRVIAKQ